MARVSPFIFCKMAFLSLRRHPIRSSLALLGIVIGIASMVVTMALGEGENERLQKEILSMGKDWIYIFQGNHMNQGGVQKERQETKPLRYEDYQAIRQFSPDIYASTPYLDSQEEVKSQANQVVAEIQGVNEEFFRIESRQIQKGMAFSSYHDKASIKVAVLGSEVAKELFKRGDPIGKTIFIAKVPFQVIGVFSEAPKAVNQFHDPNLNVVVPFSTVWKKMIPSYQNALQRIIVRPKAEKNSTQLVVNLRRLLRFRHQLSEQQPDDFTIWDLQAMMQAAYKSSQIFNQFLLIAASVSLLVGGIGIMNIMLVAMTERRKEIGIKMAIGATSGHILFQFLVESVVLCLTGGIVGILCGIGATYVVGMMTTFEWAIRQTPLVIALGTTVIVGLFFGFYPAYKASKLHPIEALQTL
jgi:putative ABC transport system permease protein